MLIILPILIPMLAAALCTLAWGRARLQTAIASLSSLAVLVVAAMLLTQVRADGIQAVAIGGWAAPFGISLVADLFACVMVLVAAITGFAVTVFAIAGTDRVRAANGQPPLTLCLLAAVSGAFLSGDIFNLYVWFELMLLSSFVLLTLGGDRRQIEGAIKYVTLNLVSSVLFLASVGLLYAATGTLNMAHLAVRLDELNDPRAATLLSAPLLVAFGIKAAVFPVFFWLPASYHTPPAVVSALFAGLLTKVGVYSIARVALLMFDQEHAVLGEAILLVAGLTMTTGVLGAIIQSDMRRILSFHIISQIGYMLMGLGIALVVAAKHGESGELGEAGLIALAGMVFYIVHHIIAKTNLFLVSGAILHDRGTAQLDRVNGLATTHPVLATLFIISALSLAGIPVFSGFWPKLALVTGGLSAGRYIIVAVSLAVSLCTLYSMVKIWSGAFWGSPDEADTSERPTPTRRAWATMLTPIAMLAALNIALGLGAGPMYNLARETAAQLLDSGAYIDAVLGADFDDSPGRVEQ